MKQRNAEKMKRLKDGKNKQECSGFAWNGGVLSN